MHLSTRLSGLASDSSDPLASAHRASALVGDLGRVPTRGVGLHCTSTPGVRPCPLERTNQCSGQSLKAKAALPAPPHCPVNAKPVVLRDGYKVRKHSC